MPSRSCLSYLELLAMKSSSGHAASAVKKCFCKNILYPFPAKWATPQKRCCCQPVRRLMLMLMRSCGKNMLPQPMDLSGLKGFLAWICPKPQLFRVPPGADSAMVTQESLLSSWPRRWVSYEAVLLLRSATAPALTSAFQHWKEIRVS